MNESEIVIFGGLNVTQNLKDYCVFDTMSERIVESKDLAGSDDCVVPDRSFVEKTDYDSVIFLSKGNQNSFKLCKLKPSLGKIETLQEIDYDHI